MRLRICCCYCPNQNTKDDRSTLPRVVVEQPRRHTILRNKITETTVVPAEESAVQSKEVESMETAVQGKEGHEVDSFETVPDKGSSDIEEIKPTTQIVPVNTLPTQDDSSSMAPPPATSRQVESLDKQKIDAVASCSTEQNQSTVSFTVAASGHLKSVYKGTEYFILNGVIEKINGPYDDSDKEFMLLQYELAMQGVRQAMLGIEQGLKGMEMNTAKLTEPLRELVATHKPPNPQNGITQQQLEELLKVLRS